MYELIAQGAKYIFVVLIYYFLYNFLKLMYFDIIKDQNISKDIDYVLRAEDGKIFPLTTINTIGRAEDSDIVINNPYLSSKHAIITKQGRKITIQDLNSTNGTFVNGKKIKRPFTLKENDEISLGSVKFLFIRRKPHGQRGRINL